MGKVIIQEETTKNPISLIGKEAGVCWGADVNDDVKNYRRGFDCINSNHGRTLEFPQVYMILSGYSIRFGREFYTHIAGGPSRLQSSTRYINYAKGFEYIIPKSVANNPEAEKLYIETMDVIRKNCKQLEDMGIPREDSAMQLPLAMTSNIVVRTNLRHLVDMSRQRMCSRAFWEFRQFMNDLIKTLEDYSPEWKKLVSMGLFHAKCDDLGYCPEKKGCGRHEN